MKKVTALLIFSSFMMFPFASAVNAGDVSLDVDASRSESFHKNFELGEGNYSLIVERSGPTDPSAKIFFKLAVPGTKLRPNGEVFLDFPNGNRMKITTFLTGRLSDRRGSLEVRILKPVLAKYRFKIIKNY